MSSNPLTGEPTTPPTLWRVVYPDGAIYAGPFVSRSDADRAAVAALGFINGLTVVRDDVR